MLGRFQPGRKAGGVGLALFPLMAGHFINDIYSNFLPAYIPSLIAKFALSLTLAGLASSVYTMASSFTQLLFGYLGDRLKLARLALAAPLITAIFMSSVGVMPSYPLVLCVLFLAALGTASFHPWATSLVGGLSRRHKGTSISIFIAAGSLGFALGPLLATGFISLMGFGRSYLLALPAVLIGAIFPLLRRGGLRARPKGAEPQARLGPEPLPRRPQRQRQPRSHRQSQLPELLRSLGPILPLGVVVILRSTVQIAFSTFLLVLLEERDLPHLAGSLILGLLLLMGSLGILLGGYLSDRLGRRAVTVLSLTLAYPLYLGFLSTRGTISFLFLAGAGLLTSASNPVIVTQAQELAPGHVGMASALTMGFGWGIAGLLMGLVGWLGDLFGLSASLKWTILALPLAVAVSLKTKEASPSGPLARSEE